MPCMIESLGCVPSFITCLNVYIASLVHMPRLHYIGMHASPLDQAMIKVEGSLVCLYALHYIWNRNGTLGPLGHHALKCAIGGSRIKNHVPLSLKHDKGCVGAHICLECIAMPCFALCCCQNRILQEALAGRPSLVPTDQVWMADSLTCGWWSFPMAGAHSLWPVVFPNVQRVFLGNRAILRGAEYGKQRQLVHGSGFPSENENAHIGPSSRGFLLFY